MAYNVTAASDVHLVGAVRRVGNGLAVIIPAAIRMIRQVATVHDVTPELSVAGGRARGELRKVSKNASLVDGIILATARALDVTLVSDAPAFRKERRAYWPPD